MRAASSAECANADRRLACNNNTEMAGCGLFVVEMVGRHQHPSGQSTQPEASMSLIPEPLPHLRFEIIEAARILRMSRATLYERIRTGNLKAQRDGRRRYITAEELHRYIASKT